MPHCTNSRILVVRLGAMGDILHALPAVASLKAGFPGARLTWLVESRWAPLLQGNPFADRVVWLRRGTVAGMIRSWRDLCSESYDLAVDFQGLIKSALPARLSGAGEILGFDPSQVREREAAVFYTRTVRAGLQHVVDRNLELAAAGGGAAIAPAFPLPPGVPEGDLPLGPFVLASPLAGWRSKQWPMEFYGALAARLAELDVPLLLDGPRSAGEALSGAQPARPHISGLHGLIHATRRAAAVVGVDSGPMHLAACLGKPGVAIFGPTDPARNGPYGGSLRVLRSHSAVTTYKRREHIDESMRQISPDAVFEILKPILNAQPPMRGRGPAYGAEHLA